MPWQMSYWLEAQKYFPLYWGPSNQDVISELPSDNPSNGLANGWRMPANPSDPGPWTWKNYWHYSYEPKVLGAFSARKVMMPENLIHMPPFGFIKVNTPLYRPHAIGSIKVHMRVPLYITPHDNPWGPRARAVSPNLLQHTPPMNADDKRNFVSDDMREVKATIDKERQERLLQNNPKYAERVKSKRNKDLFK